MLCFIFRQISFCCGGECQVVFMPDYKEYAFAIPDIQHGKIVEIAVSNND